MCKACDDVVRYCENAGPACDPQPYVTAKSLGSDVQEARLVDEFRFAINELGDVITEVRDRLRPVSQIEYPEPGGSPEIIVVSDARTELYRLHQLTSGLRDVIYRLEV